MHLHIEVHIALRAIFLMLSTGEDHVEEEEEEDDEVAQSRAQEMEAMLEANAQAHQSCKETMEKFKAMEEAKRVWLGVAFYGKAQHEEMEQRAKELKEYMVETEKSLKEMLQDKSELPAPLLEEMTQTKAKYAEYKAAIKDMDVKERTKHKASLSVEQLKPILKYELVQITRIANFQEGVKQQLLDLIEADDEAG